MMGNNFTENIVDKMEDDKSKKLIDLMRSKDISDGLIMLTLFGLGSHTEYYNVLYNRINNINKPITDHIIKKEMLVIFYEIDRNEQE